MKRPYQILLVAVGIMIFALIGTLPELIAAWPERKLVSQTFSSYSNALVDQRFEEAYGYQSPEFKDQVSFASFVQYQRDVQAKFGTLRSVQPIGMTVQKWRNPSRWRASITADFQYEKARVRVAFELHREGGRWTIFSSSGEEK
jgi:hypothetical protein